MNDEEVIFTLRALEALSVRVGLGGLVEQERATARAGQITEFERSVSVPGASSPFYTPRKGEFRIEAFTPRQRLAILLDLLEAAVVGADLTEKAVLATALAFVERGDLTSSEVSFGTPSESSDLLTEEEDLPSDAAELGSRLVLSAIRSSDRDASIESVARLIAALRREANISRGNWLQPTETIERRGAIWPA